MKGKIRFYLRENSNSTVQTPVLVLSGSLEVDLDLKIDVNKMFLVVVDGKFGDLQFVTGLIDKKGTNL
jgi:hypothetical protein